MKQFLFILLVLALSFQASAKTYKMLKVAVVDTGLDLNDPRLSGHLCTTGHKDFTGYGIKDAVGHGSHVVGTIEKYAGDSDYCLVIYKYYSETDSGVTNLTHELQAFYLASISGVSIVNFSSNGPSFVEDEFLMIRDNPDVTFVVAAGNEGRNLDVKGNEQYPASYFLKNEFIVENVESDGALSPYSNYSSKAVKEVGVGVYSTLPDGKYGFMSGTSMSTAVRTGKLIKERSNEAN